MNAVRYSANKPGQLIAKGSDRTANSSHATTVVLMIRLAPDLGNQLRSQLEPLERKFGYHEVEASDIGARPGETGDQTGRDGVNADGKDDRDRRGRVFRREYRRRDRRL
jgi:hypothetical protein